VHHRIDFADVGEELVAEALALRRAFDEAGDVDELDDGGNLLFGLTTALSCSSRGSGTSTTPTFARRCRTGSSPPRPPWTT